MSLDYLCFSLFPIMWYCGLVCSSCLQSIDFICLYLLLASARHNFQLWCKKGWTFCENENLMGLLWWTQRGYRLALVDKLKSTYGVGSASFHLPLIGSSPSCLSLSWVILSFSLCHQLYRKLISFSPSWMYCWILYSVNSFLLSLNSLANLCRLLFCMHYLVV